MMLLDILRDAHDSDTPPPPTLAQRELALDKTLIQLIQHACKTDRLARALDLVRLLHHAASLDSAAKVAGFYHLAGLQEKIVLLRAEREGRDEHRRERRARGEPVPASYVVHDEREQQRARAFQDFRPPPEIRRPGLERAALAPQGGAGPSRQRPAASGRVRTPPDAEEFQANAPLEDGDDGYGTGMPEGKRKRLEEEDGSGNTKRRAVDEAGPGRMSSTSECKFAIVTDARRRAGADDSGALQRQTRSRAKQVRKMAGTHSRRPQK
jgi:chromosome transmission fidelity protein 4